MQREPIKIRDTTSTITWRNRRDHILARIGVRRAHLRPGVGLIILVQVLRGRPVFSGYGAAAITVLLSAYILFPILLPYLPTRDFGSKGFILGGLTASPFALIAYLGRQSYPWWFRLLAALPASLVIPSIVAFVAFIFMGSSTFIGRSALRHGDIHLSTRDGLVFRHRDCTHRRAMGHPIIGGQKCLRDPYPIP